MDEQTLQRLMIDDALDSLSPDVRALLAAFVRTRSDGEKDLTQWRALGTAARQTMDDGQTISPPRNLLRGARIRHFTRLAASAAAILAIGFALGIGIARKPAPIVQITPTVASVMEEPSTTPAGGGFWSSQRLLAMALQSEQNSPAPRQWTWPTNESNSGETR